MPTDLTLKAMNAVHRTVLMVTGGRIGWTLLEHAGPGADHHRPAQRPAAHRSC